MADASMSPASSSDLYPPSDHDVPMTAPAPSGEASAANRTDALFDDFSNADSQHARKNEESGDDLFGDRISISNHPLHPKRKRTSDGEGSERPVNGEVFEENGTTIPEHAPDPKRQRHDGLVQGLRTTLYPRTERLHGGLTVPIWRRIFCYVPPVFLGRLLRVDRTFHGLLNTPPLSPKDPAQDAGGPSQISAESIWISSRKRFAPGLPRTIPGQSELDMWRLLRGNVCQLCGEKKPLLTISESLDPWRSGPGSECVRVVWPFGVRSCGRCLQANSEQVGKRDMICSGFQVANISLGGYPTLFFNIPGLSLTSFAIRVHHTVPKLCRVLCITEWSTPY